MYSSGANKKPRIESQLIAYVFSVTLLLISSMPHASEIDESGLSNGDAEVSKPDDSGLYQIEVGDLLQVFVWRNPELSVNIPVRPDGYVSIPLVDDLYVTGQTTTAVAREIEEKLKAYIKFPKVSVMVTDFGMAYGRLIRVIGQAAEPQALTYRKDMSLLDVIIAVDGLTEFAAGNRAVLIRGDGKDQQRIPLRLEDLLEDGEMSQNLMMRPGDVVIIPESYF